MDSNQALLPNEPNLSPRCLILRERIASKLESGASSIRVGAPCEETCRDPGFRRSGPGVVWVRAQRGAVRWRDGGRLGLD